MAQYQPSAIRPVAGALPDDGDLETTQARICVDYLSHNWKEEDVWRSWRSMTRFKYEIANGMRLENASWRTWWKQRNKLGTVSPETLNWLKDSDVTWLYGPLHTAPEVTLKESSTADKLGVDIPKPKAKQPEQSPPPLFTRNRTSSTTKSILKQRSVTDILAAAVVPPRNPQHSSSPIYEQVAVEMEGTLNPTESEPQLETEPTTLPPAAGVLVPPSRPPLWQTKSDSFVTRQSMGVTLSTSPMSIKGLSPPGESAIVDHSKSASLSPPDHPRARHGHRSDSSSSYQVSDDSNAGPPRPKRHISFNSFVEQRIVIDPISTRLSTVYARSSSESGSDEEEEDTILQMRSSSGSSLSSSRRGSTNSRTSSSEISTTNKLTSALTMITAPIAPTLLKEPDDLPAPSPAVVFVAPHGVDEEALKYEAHLASKPRFAVPADRKRVGEANWSPGTSNWYDQGEEMLDYFSGVPLNGEPPEPSREPIYTDEDEDAITLRTRQRALRSPRLNGAGGRESMSPTEEQSSPITPETAHPVPRRSSFAKKSQQDFGSSPPTISHEEVARSSVNDASTISKPLGVPRRTGSGSDIQFGGSSYSNGGSVGSAPRSSHLSASMSSMRSGRSGTRNRAPSASSFDGVDMAGHTSALSGRTGFESTVQSPPRDSDLSDTRGRGREQRIQEEMERPRRGRSLLRTGSSSTISERERSSTTGSSSSPMGSLSPRSTSSVGIVGGYIVPPSGLGSIIVPSGSVPKSSSGLRYESGSWSAEEEQGAIDGGDYAQVSPTRSKPAPPSGGLIRVSSSSNVSQTSTQTTPRVSGIRRTNSSTNVTAKASGLQRTSSSSNIFSSTAQSTTTHLITTVPILTLQPPSSQGTSFDNFPHAGSPGVGSASGSASHSPEGSTGSFWKANELELESPATPPSPAETIPTPSDPFEEPSLHRDLLLSKNSIKPRASGMSLASSTSNGSNESSATVVPKNSKAAKRLSSQLASASSSISSNSSFNSGHRRSGSKSSVASVGPATPPMAIRSTSASSGSTLSVTQAVAMRSEVGSPAPSSTRRHLRKLSGGVPTPAEDKPSPAVANSSPISVSPGFMSHVVGNAKGFFDALWGGNGGDHSG